MLYNTPPGTDFVTRPRLRICYDLGMVGYASASMLGMLGATCCCRMTTGGA